MLSQLQLFPEDCASGLDLYSPGICKIPGLLWCSLSLGSDLKDLKLSLSYNPDPMKLVLLAYWCCSDGALFYISAWTQLLHRQSYSWAIPGSDSSYKPVDAAARSSQWSSWDEGNAVHTLTFPSPCPHHILIHMISSSTSVVFSLESSQ